MFSFHRRKSRISNDSPSHSPSPHSSPPLEEQCQTTESESPSTVVNVLLVGQIYNDTILYINEYPKEDTKLRANDMEQRRGGNICNTAEVLSQFPRLNPHVMSCLGPKEASTALISSLETLGIKTKACIHRQTPTPSSYIIQSADSGSRTIISYNKTIDMTKDEFIHKFEEASNNKTKMLCDRQIPFSWVHFEGRNVHNVVEQIDWLDTKATQEGWRSQLIISVELEKPDRPDIDLLLPKGDVVFFSKLFAQTRQYNHPKDFLQAIRPQCKSSAKLFLTWGEQGASCLLENGEIIHASAMPIHQVVDSVGAGDTFIAGIIFCLCRKLNVLTALKFSCELASRKVTQNGFNGLAKLMSRLWEASLDIATGHKHLTLSSTSEDQLSTTSSTPFI
ncbi:putative PfkB family kinase [Halteromyces radiatus]|uniref:putative PfkB family kinase n=1 Tax=Halteromyces radiatus TaxID=101107 RepID=UPI00221FD981|nr:putative PfkB family kinase [Halteromyces radiatus]KAI8086398.1 putative PfkB family kinase [Halteromyces radiatus]